MKMKKRVLFLGGESHQTTKSHHFFLKILSNTYQIDEYYVDYNKTAKARWKEIEKFSSTHYDIVICWQYMPLIKDLKKRLNFSQGIFIPMYDGMVSTDNFRRWKNYEEFLIICFCKKVYDDLTREGFSCRYIQYFPKPSKELNLGNSHSLFFWNRLEAINSQIVEKLFGNYPLEKVVIHKALDPNQTFVRPSGKMSEIVEYTSWFPEKKDMLAAIEQSAFYIAPRLAEGIGMSFLEAMAMGRCVIAPDIPTMNEYIQDGKTGYLYEYGDIEPILFENIQAIQKQTYSYMSEGYEKWERDKWEILEWIEEKVNPPRFFQLKRRWRYCLNKRS